MEYGSRLARLVCIVQNRPNTRGRLLDAAGELLRTKGPNASGTTEILARANAPRGSFYFHFPNGKEQLLAEALDRCAAATAGAMIDALEDGSIPMPQRIERFVKAVATNLVADDYRLGCAVGATVLEASVTSPSLRDVTDTAFASWTSALTERLAGAGVDPGRAAVLADAVIAGMEGATMMARARRDPAPLEHVATTLGAMVAAALDETSQAA